MVKRWDVVTIGNLSRNHYWGEPDNRALRAPLSTSTLITGDGWRLLVDPPYADGLQMAEELNRRTGLHLGDITHIFITHGHADHHAGLKHFTDATWLAAPAVANALNDSNIYNLSIGPAEGRLLDDLEILPTPGHTPDHHSLRFECEGKAVVIAGDAVMTRDFWRDRKGFFNSADFEQVTRTMASLAELAAVIVPGHDNYFVV
jgi:glyoxylase-like metal-dependent hydrolase (beta-lactamase superfamily II)